MGVEQVGALIQAVDTPRYYSSESVAPRDRSDDEERTYGSSTFCPDLEAGVDRADEQETLLFGRWPMIFATDFIFVFGVSFTLTVLPELVNLLDHGTEKVTKSSAALVGQVLATSSFFKFCTMQGWGSYSDANGRRPVLMIAATGAATAFFIQASAQSIGPLFLGAFISGCTEVTPMISLAYLADIMARDELGPQMALMRGISEGVGIAFALPVSGLVAQAFGVRVPFWVAAFGALLSLLITVFYVRESLAEDNRRKFKWSDANVFTGFTDITATRAGASASYALFLFNVAHSFVLTNLINYFDYAFGWSVVQTGFAFAVLGCSLALVPSQLISKYGEEVSMQIGLVSYSAGLVMMAIIPNGWCIYLLIPFFSAGLCVPAATVAHLSAQVDERRQGKTQSIAETIKVLGQSVGSVSSAALLSRFMSEGDGPKAWAGGIWLIGCLCTTLAFVIVFREKQRADEKREERMLAGGSSPNRREYGNSKAGGGMAASPTKAGRSPPGSPARPAASGSNDADVPLTRDQIALRKHQERQALAKAKAEAKARVDSEEANVAQTLPGRKANKVVHLPKNGSSTGGGLSPEPDLSRAKQGAQYGTSAGNHVFTSGPSLTEMAAVPVPPSREEKVRAATQIQSVARGHNDRREMQQKHDAAERIQAVQKGRAARQDAVDRQAAATKLAAVERGRQDRAWANEQKEAASKIAALKRGTDARRDLEDKHNAATKIQAVQRGKAAREDAVRREESAVKIQAASRGRAVRKPGIQEREGATKIQSIQRGRNARKEAEERQKAATNINAAARGRAARRDMEEKHRAASKIAALQRSRAAQVELDKAKAAAVRVQAHQRGHAVRKEMAEKRELQARGNQMRRERAELEEEKRRRGTTRAPITLVTSPSSPFGGPTTKFKPGGSR